MYFYHPHLITNIAAICVPFSAPTRYNLSLEQLVERFPNFRYQIAFAGPELEKQVNTKEAIGKFLNALHQKTNPKKGAVLPMNNKDADILTVLGNPLRTANFTEEDWEFYKQEFARNGMKGPCK